MYLQGDREIEESIWGENSENKVRVFLSHRSTDRELVASYKKKLADYGCTCFVAHEDIEPGAEWVKTIEAALSSMDFLVAFLSQGFHGNTWTDQEIGYALGARISVLAVKLSNSDPAGFIAHRQALACNIDDINIGVKNIVKYAIEKEIGNIKDALIEHLKAMRNWNDTSALEMLGLCESLTPEQSDNLIDLHNGTHMYLSTLKANAILWSKIEILTGCKRINIDAGYHRMGKWKLERAAPKKK